VGLQAVDGQPPTYVREVTFSAQDAANFTYVANQIKELIKTYKTRCVLRQPSLLRPRRGAHARGGGVGAQGDGAAREGKPRVD
jgi:hypothetical protein